MTWTIVSILTFVRLLLVIGNSDSAKSKNDTTMSLAARILNGHKAEVSNLRFMVRLETSKGGCGGSIIANNWVLTASHCIYDLSCDTIEMYPLMWKDDEYINPIECYLHEEYQKSHLEHDIALLRAAKDLLWDLRASALNLPPPGKRYPSETSALVVGWGRTETGEPHEDLLEGEVRLTSWDTCNSKHRENHRLICEIAECEIKDLPLRLVCAVGFGANPSGTCFGDSGGPIIADRNMIGISTILLTTDGNCEVGAPAGFLSIVDYLPWIYKHTDPSKDTSEINVDPEHPSP